MKLEREYNGKTYYRNNSKWVDKDSLAVPLYLQHILNTLYYQETDTEQMSYNEAKDEGDKYKQSETFFLAVKYYEQALKKAKTQRQISVLLPRITSCYRKNEQPRKVIELMSDMKLIYGEGIITEVLLTSVAAAYCDLGEPENAIRCCRWAYRVLKSNENDKSIELSKVFIRANKMLDPDYLPDEEFEEDDDIGTYYN